MGDVFRELFRIAAPGGDVAFEVGEVRKNTVRLEEQVMPLGVAAGFTCEGIIINQQAFSKTSHIWGIDNNRSVQTRTGRKLFQKPSPLYSDSCKSARSFELSPASLRAIVRD